MAYGEAMSELPDKALLPLSKENAVWLHLYADKHFGGDVTVALNNLR